MIYFRTIFPLLLNIDFYVQLYSMFFSSFRRNDISLWWNLHKRWSFVFFIGKWPGLFGVLYDPFDHYRYYFHNWYTYSLIKMWICITRCKIWLLMLPSEQSSWSKVLQQEYTSTSSYYCWDSHQRDWYSYRIAEVRLLCMH